MMRKKHDHTRNKPVLLGTNMARAAAEDPDTELKQLSSLSLLPCAFFSRFLSPSLTRTKPICSETRVTDGVGKPCSRMLPWDAPFSQYFVFSSQLLHVGGAARDASSVKPHSCHTLALLQYISSSRGHDFASLAITGGISDYHFHCGMYFPCKS